MSSGLDLTGLIPGLEALLLLDSVVVTAPASSSRVLDPATGQLADPPQQQLYAGAGAVFPAGTQPGPEAPFALRAWRDQPAVVFRLFTPVSAPVIPRDALVSVSASARDGALLGRTWRAVEVSAAASQVVLRLTWLQQVDGSA